MSSRDNDLFDDAARVRDASIPQNRADSAHCRQGSAQSRPDTQRNRPDTQQSRPDTQRNRAGSAKNQPGTSRSRPGSARSRQDAQQNRAEGGKSRPGTQRDRRLHVGWHPQRWPEFMREPVEHRDPVPELPSGPRALIRVLLRRNLKPIVLCSAVLAMSYISMALVPWAIGILLDSGLHHGLTAAFVPPAFLFVGTVLLAAFGGLAETPQTALWLRGTWDPVRLLMRKVFMRRTTTSQEMPSGDLVAVVTSDSDKMGALLDWIPELVSSLAAFAVVAVLMLRVSLPLGLFVIIGMPLLLYGISRIIKPLQERIATQREEQGKLTALASDAIVGLRVLRGVGGEDRYNEVYVKQSRAVQEAGIRAARPRALLDAIQTAGPALFTAIVVGGGLWMTYLGSMTPGELVAFYGYTAFLSMPISSISQMIQITSRAWVAAKKFSRVFKGEPLVGDGERQTSDDERQVNEESRTGSGSQAGEEPQADDERQTSDDEPWPDDEQNLDAEARVGGEEAVECGHERSPDRTPDRSFGRARALLPAPDWRAMTLTDPASGVAVRPGLMTALVSAASGETRTIASRLSRRDDRDEIRADGVDMRRYPIDEVRRGIVYVGPIAELFTGTLRSGLLGPNAPDIEPREIRQQIVDILAPDGDIRPLFTEPTAEADSDEQVLAALRTAHAHDVLESLPEGLDGHISERGRSLSGGQRQRSVLARALYQEPPILILVEPTSAVDSHTEARIAANLAATRSGRTTVLVTTSPLLLNHCDEVVLVRDGKEVARGTHRQLLESPEYFAVVHRGERAQSATDQREQSGTKAGEENATSRESTAGEENATSRESVASDDKTGREKAVAGQDKTGSDKKPPTDHSGDDA